MKFEKPSLTIEQQADLLVQRGMAGDRALMIERLRVVGYYRLSGYWYPFRKAVVQRVELPEGTEPDEAFVDGTSFETVWRRYAFDRRLRVLVIDAIERFEITLRTQIATHHCLHHGPFAYALDRASRPKLKRTAFAEFYAGVPSYSASKGGLMRMENTPEAQAPRQSKGGPRHKHALTMCAFIEK